MKNNDVELRTVNYNDFNFDDKSLNVSGYVNQTGVPSQTLGEDDQQFIEIMSPGVFQSALQEADYVDFYYEHDPEKVLATTQNSSLTLNEDDTGLKMSANIVNTSWGQDAYNMIKQGLIKGMSFGMIVLDDDWDMSGDIPVRTINQIMLFEVSAVRFPAYPASSIESRNLQKNLESRGLNLTKTPKIPKKKEERDVNNSGTDNSNLINAANELSQTVSTLTDAINSLVYSITQASQPDDDGLRSKEQKRDGEKAEDEEDRMKDMSKRDDDSDDDDDKETNSKKPKESDEKRDDDKETDPEQNESEVVADEKKSKEEKKSKDEKRSTEEKKQAQEDADFEKEAKEEAEKRDKEDASLMAFFAD